MTCIEIQLWAPLAKQAYLHTLGRKIPMDRCLGFDRYGCWHSPCLSIVDAELGDYLVSVDELPARPDPRSGWQPYGVHGPSRYVDHAQFTWNDQTFQARPLSAAVIYELHVGTFSPAGTFAGVIDYLPHLVQLGVTHVELMPLADFPGQFGWGYDGVCLYAPAHKYGGPFELKRLIDACHRHGLAVILDVVYNHLGPVGNHLSEFGPYFSTQHKTPWGDAINFDGPHSDGVRRFFCDNALMWLRDYHIDGLRLDAVHAIVDCRSETFLEQLAFEVEQLAAHLGKHLCLIAESDLNDPRLIRGREAGGFALNAQWSDDFHHALHTTLTGESAGYYADFSGMECVAAGMQHPYLYTGQHSVARQRSHGRPASALSGHRFISFTQNHDQIGNRALGERLGQLVGWQRAKIAAAWLMFSPYVPQLFQGEEWNSSSPFLYFADWREQPELADAVRLGRQAEFAHFGWTPEQLRDPSDPAVVEVSRLDWANACQPDGADMLQWYQQLIQLRRQYPELSDGNFEAVETDSDPACGQLVVRRGRLTLISNLSEQTTEPIIATPYRYSRCPPRYGGSSEIVLASDNTARILPTDNRSNIIFNSGNSRTEGLADGTSASESSWVKLLLPGNSVVIIESYKPCPR